MSGAMNGTIHILGKPGVHAKLNLPSVTPVKFLEFATNIYKLVCIGEEGTRFENIAHTICQMRMISCMYGTFRHLDKLSLKLYFALSDQ
jgi:hypothetical protein